MGIFKTTKETSLSLQDIAKHLKKEKLYVLSPTKLKSVTNKTQKGTYFKPYGLWFACGDAWIQFITGEQYAPHEYKYLYEVKLRKKHILTINTLAQLHNFQKQYGHAEQVKHLDYGKLLFERRRVYIVQDYHYIDWKKVQDAGYTGVVICPFLLSKTNITTENIAQYFWYWAWDIASGVVWNKDAVKQVSLLYQNENGWKIHT